MFKKVGEKEMLPLDYPEDIKNLFDKDIQVDVISTSITFSQGLDYARKGLLNHHLRVSLLSLYIGEAVKLPDEELFQLFRAAIIHDLGAVTMKEKAALLDFEIINANLHTLKGYYFLQDLSIFRRTAEIVRTHHDRWDGKHNHSGLAGDNIPLASRIIHLADRVDVLLQILPKKESPLALRDEVSAHIQRFSGDFFDPELAAVFKEVIESDNILLDLDSPWVAEKIMDLLPNSRRNLNAAELLDLAEVFARVVDTKSSYTYLHSHGVAQTARTLAELIGCQPNQVFLIYIAGLLHDLGKLTIPETILDKPGALTKDEMYLMKQHAYYSYWWLKMTFGKTPIAEWAAFHHERLDGKGYPFRKKGEKLDFGARVVAVSDVFTALREDRPYRASLSWDTIERIMRQLVKDSALDGDIVDVLLNNKDLLENRWQELVNQAKEKDKVDGGFSDEGSC